MTCAFDWARTVAMSFHTNWTQSIHDETGIWRMESRRPNFSTMFPNGIAIRISNTVASMDSARWSLGKHRNVGGRSKLYKIINRSGIFFLAVDVIGFSDNLTSLCVVCSWFFCPVKKPLYDEIEMNENRPMSNKIL